MRSTSAAGGPSVPEHGYQPKKETSATRAANADVMVDPPKQESEKAPSPEMPKRKA